MKIVNTKFCQSELASSEIWLFCFVFAAAADLVLSRIKAAILEYMLPLIVAVLVNIWLLLLPIGFLAEKASMLSDWLLSELRKK